VKVGGGREKSLRKCVETFGQEAIADRLVYGLFEMSNRLGTMGTMGTTGMA
jgi:hypothetical protein